MIIFRENYDVVLSHNSEEIFRKVCKTKKSSEKAYMLFCKLFGINPPYFGK